MYQAAGRGNSINSKKKCETDRPLKPRFRGHITLILDTLTLSLTARRPPSKKLKFFLYLYKIDFEVGIPPLISHVPPYHQHQIRPPRPSTMVHFRGNPALIEEN